MGWFQCLRSPKTSDDKGFRDTKSPTPLSSHHFRKASTENLNEKPSSNRGSNAKIAAHTFRFRELASATNNFRPEYLLGEGVLAEFIRGVSRAPARQIVAIKQLDRNGHQGNREFLVEVLMLSLLHHPNLVTLIGYCADGDQRLLVYEYMPFGSLEDHLFNFSADNKPLGWHTRMRIAAGAARGLEHLHDKANPPVIYRDFKSANILLDEGYNPKLSDFGLAKLGPVGDKTHVSTRVMGTYGYCAPEYAMTGQLTLKSDVYSFGVVLLELITGRKAIDNLRPHQEHNLVKWAQSLFKDRKMFPQMADPLLEGRYPARGLYQALAIAAMCIQDQASTRPLIGDVVTALSYLASQTYDCSMDSFLSGRHSWASSITEKKDAERDLTDMQDKENEEDSNSTKQGEILKSQTSDCDDGEQDLGGDFKVLA